MADNNGECKSCEKLAAEIERLRAEVARLRGVVEAVEW